MSRTSRPNVSKIFLAILGMAASAAFYTHDVLAASGKVVPAALHHHIVAKGDPEHAYALVRETGHGINMSGDSANWKDIEAARRKLSGDFLWFRDGGMAYVVQDPQVLAKAREAWAPVERRGEQMDGYGRQMDKHGKVLGALGKEMEAAAAHLRFASMEEIGQRMKDAGKPMDALGKQMDALGKQIEQESHAADAAVRELIRDALAKGLAQPAPVQG